jgi:hypothetical protein
MSEPVFISTSYLCSYVYFAMLISTDVFQDMDIDTEIDADIVTDMDVQTFLLIGHRI